MIRSTETTFNAHILIVFALNNLHKREKKVHIWVYNGMTQVIEVLFSLGPMSEWSLKSAADATLIH